MFKKPGKVELKEGYQASKKVPKNPKPPQGGSVTKPPPKPVKALGK